MGKAKDFFIAIPYLCLSDNAQRWSWNNKRQFEDELNKGTLFDRNASDILRPFNRLETAFGFTAFAHDKDRSEYCKILAELFMLSHYAQEHHQEEYNDRIKELVDAGLEYEGKYPDIDEVFTLDDAASDGGWK